MASSFLAAGHFQLCCSKVWKVILLKNIEKKELRSAKRTNYISRIVGGGEGVLKLDSILAE